MTGCGSRGDHSEVAAGEAGGGVVELRVIEDIVAFQTELNTDIALRHDVEVLGQNHVRVVDSGTVIRVAVDVAEGSKNFRLKCRRASDKAGFVGLSVGDVHRVSACLPANKKRLIMAKNFLLLT